MNPLSRILAWRPALVLFVMALALRMLAVQWLWTPGKEPRSYEHGEIAANLVEGRGFRVRFLGVDRYTSQQAPFYPYLLAAAYWSSGGPGLQGEIGVQLVQCLAGAVLCVAVARLTQAVLHGMWSAPWIAGYGAALYPPHVYMVTHLQVALWAALWLTLLATWCLSADPRRIWRTGVVGGLLGGLLLLTEPILGLALPILAVALWRRAYALSESLPAWLDSLRPAAVMTAVTCLVIAPWLERNYRVHGEFVFIKSTFGYAFWQGNNASSWGTDKIPMQDAIRRLGQHDGSLRSMNQAIWEARYETTYIDDLLLTPDDYAQFALLSEPASSRLLGDRARAFIREHPERYARLCLRRLRYFLLFDETNPKASHVVYRASTIAWLALSIVGLVATRRQWRTLWPTYAIFAAVLLFHALTITSARFRIPVEPLTFPWCAGGVVWLVGSRRFFRPSAA